MYGRRSGVGRPRPALRPRTDPAVAESLAFHPSAPSVIMPRAVAWVKKPQFPTRWDIGADVPKATNRRDSVLAGPPTCAPRPGYMRPR